jgi:hypothetical protein
MVFITAAAAFADKKSDSKFLPGPASSYSNKQTNDKVTIAVTAYDTEELAHTAFGKLDPNQYGVLPVLVIIQNDTDQALKLDHVQVEYTGVDNRHVEATPPSEILPLLREHLHSRVPVFEDTVDHIVGVLYTKDLLPHLKGLPPDFDLRSRLHPPYFVPESKRADALLREFQAKKLRLAVVVGE